MSSPEPARQLIEAAIESVRRLLPEVHISVLPAYTATETYTVIRASIGNRTVMIRPDAGDIFGDERAIAADLRRVFEDV